MATNRCPCGYYGDIKRECRCSPVQIERYRQRISGPLLDRIDLHVELPIVDFRELSSDTNTGEKSSAVRDRVAAARHIQRERFKKASHSTNSTVGSRLVRQHCKLDKESSGYLEHATEQMNFSARAHDRIPQGRPHPRRPRRCPRRPPQRHPRGHPIPRAGPEVVRLNPQVASTIGGWHFKDSLIGPRLWELTLPRPDIREGIVAILEGPMPPGAFMAEGSFSISFHPAGDEFGTRVNLSDRNGPKIGHKANGFGKSSEICP